MKVFKCLWLLSILLLAGCGGGPLLKGGEEGIQDPPKPVFATKPVPVEKYVAPLAQYAPDPAFTPYTRVAVNPVLSARWKRSHPGWQWRIGPRETRVITAMACASAEGCLTSQEWAELREMVRLGQCEKQSLEAGFRFSAVSERPYANGAPRWAENLEWQGKKPLSTRACQLTSGRVLTQILACGNWSLPYKQVMIASPTSLLPRRQELPETRQPETKAERDKESLMRLDYDLWLSIGGVHGNGSDTIFGYAAPGIYPVISDLENGRVEIGVAGHYGYFQGHTETAFQFAGQRYGVGPAVKYFSWDGWDGRVSPIGGGVFQSGHSGDGAFQQHRSFPKGAGFDIGGNWYARQLAGETWFPKGQAFAQFLFPIGGHAHASWQGQAVDPQGYERLNVIGGVGVRQFIYDFEYIRTFCGADWFGQLPGNQSLNLTCGITDKKEIFWFWVGPSLNLVHGGVAGLWTIGVDAGNAIRYGVDQYRQDQWHGARERGRALRGQGGHEADVDPQTGTMRFQP